ncbi:shikimate kinase [Actinomycetospora sp. NBRC 106375]|uniref:shikimate kinase n=1 Tax=Actinomycetospora sp. NBRC 106375 TaxID=3032207 RepID=UPI00249FFBCB|nr:shikimate kinase [Actinomycetospora sp. NBRC 106375]GLZ44123.1 shikimate kinase [Actinomycetospora sp. NBRC 106375]
MSPVAVLVGPPGAGKSTVGALLAERLGVVFTDTDTIVETTAGRAISDIFLTDGEPAFRTMERDAVAAALSEHDGVLALGGGAVMTEAVRDLLDGHPVIFLGVGLAAGVRRVGLSTARPLLAGVNPRATFSSLLQERLPVYRAVARHEIATDDLEPAAVVDAVLAALSPEAADRANG